jgi:hypothetical protein
MKPVISTSQPGSAPERGKSMNSVGLNLLRQQATPNPALNADAHRRAFSPPAVAG